MMMMMTSQSGTRRQGVVVVCPGQGAQAVGMGRAWYEGSEEARGVFAAAERVLGGRLGAPLTELCFSGPAERLNQTDVAQPALYVCGVASLAGLCARWGVGMGEVELAGAAGLSLGEYTALHVAGAVSFEDGLELVTLRGRAMQDAATAVASGMVALIGADEGQARAVCGEVLAGMGGGMGGGEVLVPANFNAPGQVVISGTKGACERAVEVAGKMGLRATALAVAGAFHSPIMGPAAERLGAALAGTRIGVPRCAVMSNVTGRPHGGADGVTMEESIRRRLVEQLTSPVRWAECCVYLAGMGAGVVEAGGEGGGGGAFHELAPGKTLAGLMRRIDRNVKVTTHDEPGQDDAAT